jgi:site-specific recombinase XerD
LSYFVDWCRDNGVEDTETLEPQHLHDYRVYRREGIAKATEKTEMDTLRVFLRYLEKLDAVRENLSETVISPELEPNEAKDETTLDADTAEDVLSYLRKYDYASVNHVVMELLWHTGMRMSALHSVDLDDYDGEEGHMKIRYRPDKGTTLKNGKQGERMVYVDEDCCQVVDDYIQDRRVDVVDDYGREPLLTTSHGRISKNKIRIRVYYVTRPCFYSDHCPHDEEIEDCEHNSWKGCGGCPSSVSPHPIRRGSITHMLKEDVPNKIVGDRVDVSQEVLDKHYDTRTEEEKMKKRREYIDT